MGAGIQNSMGVAKQFMNKPERTHAKRMQGVPLNYYVESTMDRSRSRMAQALGNLNAQINKHREIREEKLYNIAEQTTPIVLSQAHIEGKEKLGAIEMLATSGKAYLQDNPYAVAMIDRHKGEEVSRVIWQEFQEKLKSEPFPDTLEEQNKRFQEFYKERSEELFEGEHIENQYAFDEGFHGSVLANKLAMEQQFNEAKEQKLKIERDEMLKSEAQKASRYDLLKDPEATKLNLQALMNTYRATRTSDEASNRQALNDMVGTIAQNTGVVGLDTLGEMEVRDGTKLKDFMDLSSFYDVAMASDSRAYRVEYAEALKEIQAQNTEEGVRQTVAGIEHPEVQNYFEERLADFIPQAINKQVEANLRVAQMEALEAQKAYADATLGNVVQAIMEGSLTFEADDINTKKRVSLQVPTTYKQLEETTGINKKYAEAIITNKMFDKYKSGDIEGFAELVKNPMIGSAVGKYLKENLDLALHEYNGGEMKETLGIGLALIKSNRFIANKELGEETVRRLDLLKILQENYPNEAGEVFHNTMLSYDDPKLKEDVKTRISKELNGKSSYRIASVDGGKVSLDSEKNSEVYNEVFELAQMLNVADNQGNKYLDAGTASREAIKAVTKNYYNFHGVLLPKHDLTGQGMSRDLSLSSELAVKALDKRVQAHFNEPDGHFTYSYEKGLVGTVKVRRVGIIGDLVISMDDIRKDIQVELPTIRRVDSVTPGSNVGGSDHINKKPSNRFNLRHKRKEK